MLYHNSFEIAQNMERYRNHAVLGPATRILGRLYHLVNENSDGWAYWKAPVRAARQLMEMVDAARAGDRAISGGEQMSNPSELELKKALIPIKAFCTRHNLPFPSTE